MSLVTARLDPLTAVRLAALRVKYRQQTAAKTVSTFPMLPWTKYIKVTPTPTQIEFLKLQNLEALYGGAGGGGKALTLDTLLATPSGWTTMGKIQVGDFVFDDRGLPCCVLAKSEIQFNRPLYAVTFDDGSKIEADAEHLWLTFSIAERAQIWRLNDEFRYNRRQIRTSRSIGKRPDVIITNRQRKYFYLPQPPGTERTTKELFDTFRIGKRQATNYSIVSTKPLQLPERKLPIDPYLLGCWLGDGTSSSGQFTTADNEIIKAFDFGGFQPHKLNNPYAYGTFGLTTLLRQTKILNKKHIPKIYLRASESQRRALLMGLMDTDGTASKEDGGCEFTSMSKILALGVFELAVSLGIKPTLNTGRAMLYGKDCGEKFRVCFTTDIPVFRLPSKAHLQTKIVRKTQNMRYIINIEKIATKPVQCITVDSPSHLYLAGKSMIPTHNSYALLMAALQYVDQPGYSALLLRRTFADLSKPKALLDIAFQWLSKTDAVWKDKEKTWHFPSGATLTFGYMDSERDKYQYQGGSYQFVGWDELTQFYETQYRFLFGWLRGLAGSTIPLRVRGASNPGGIGHDWVKQRYFTEGPLEGRAFIPAKLQDNPYLDQETYIKSLANLDPITRAQILNGDWSARQGGSMFKREWFPVIETAPVELRKIRYWDLAATEPAPGKDPDWTVGALVGADRHGLFYILDIRRDRATPGNIERLIKQTAEVDGKQIPVRMETEPGSAGIGQIASYRKLLAGWNFGGIRNTGDKQTRAAPLASQAEGGNIKLVRAPWLSAFLDEIEQFPSGAHDDQCFPAGTLILTEYGNLPIENVKKGMRVLTRKGWQQVLFSGQTGVKPILTIDTESGKISSTLNHPFWVDNSFISAEKIKVGQCLSKLSNFKAEFTGVTLSQPGVVTEYISNVTINGRRHPDYYIGISGSILMGKSLKGLSSIIQTATPLIMSCLTLFAYANQHISKFIKSVQGKNKRHILNTSAPYRNNGIALKLEGNGIENTVSKQWQKGQYSKKPVSIVGRYFKPNNLMRSVVQVVVMKKTDRPVPVYNLKVEGDSEYFANGFLVHNCDAVSGAFNLLTGGMIILGGVSSGEKENSWRDT